ncbi:glycosyl hydrolase [Streptomyces camelliae]|uniref:Glycosyl hydrolase n=1 Tax=Streptomyces camelliae TaxID=3004093 RepID=A0ABY7NYB7_9ACTN|nr:glycosyl hydrolase [Streptomyces sp. HUAS 2-6]WBO63060.1 glycosyl hydrolase [Streptomyces sp. HUAS 2-6]
MPLVVRDPVHAGPTDPTVIRHRATGEWWMYYTQRRAGLDCSGAEWVHGTDIGIAVSADEGRTWGHRGIAEGLEHRPGRMTYWAPEVLADGAGGYHMYVTCLAGVRSSWVGDAQVRHYASADLLRWEFRSVLDLGSDRVIDAAVHPLPGGAGWRMWFKDERDDSHLHTAHSRDLYTWTRTAPAATDQSQEGPTVFRPAGVYWMVTDNWKGLSVYRSADLDTWTREPYQLLAEEPEGHHAMALEQGDAAAVLWYFTADEDDPAGRRSVVRATRLEVQGGRLTCAPETPVAPLAAGLTPAWRGGTAG